MLVVVPDEGMFGDIERKLDAAFVADRPFIYLIRDDITGEILFVGRLLEP